MVDASVAFRGFTNDPLSERCRDVFKETLATRIAPELVVYEVTNAAWKMARAGQLAWEAAREIARGIAPGFDRLVAAAELAEPALDLCRTLVHPAYDCFYLALARREGALLICADKRLAAAAERAGVAVHLIA